MKPYFCLWFDDDGMHEEFHDDYLDAWESARACEISGFRYHWGDTQGNESIDSTGTRMEGYKVNIQQQIEEALKNYDAANEQDEVIQSTIVLQENVYDWLKHQQEIISQQQEEINRLKQENTEWKRTYDRLLQGIHE